MRAWKISAGTLCPIEFSGSGPGFWRAKNLENARAHPVPSVITEAPIKGILVVPHFKRKETVGRPCTGLVCVPAVDWCNAGRDRGERWISCLQLWE